MKLAPAKNASSLIISSFIALSLISTPTSANAAAPKAGTKCTMSGQQVTSNNLTFTCTKSGKNLVWSKGVKNNSSKSAQASGGGPSVTEGFLCDPGKAMTGKSSANATYKVKQEGTNDAILNKVPQWFVDAQIEKGLITNPFYQS